MRGLIAFAICMALGTGLAAAPYAPVLDGTIRGYNGATLDLTAMTPAGKAIGDGVTDASPAFTAAAALTTPSNVTIPCGTYLLAGVKRFDIQSSIAFMGAGRQCVKLVFPAATTINDFVFNCQSNGTISCLFSGITMDLANVAISGTAPIGIISANTSRLDVVDSAFINGSAYMFFVAEMGQIKGFNVSRNIFAMKDTSFTLDGIGCVLVSSAGASVSQNGIISGNQATNCGLSVAGHDIIIDTNTFNSWGAAGVAVGTYPDANSYNITITNNDAHGSNATGVLSCMEIFSARSLVANNQLHECPGDGLDIGGQNSTIIGNTIWGNGVTTGMAAGVLIRYGDATANGSGAFIDGNNIFDGGSGKQQYAIADEPSNGAKGCTVAHPCAFTVGSNKLSGPLGPVQIHTQGVTYANGGMIAYGGTTTGSANAHVVANVTTPPIIMATLVAGLELRLVPGFSNSGATTLNVKTGIANAATDYFTVATKSTGAIAINKLSGGSLVPLAGGELLANVPTSVTYNGTVWIWGPR